jgi:hypothetical protein
VICCINIEKKNIAIDAYFFILLQETADYAGIIETSEGAKTRSLCLMLMCVQKLRILNKFGRRGRRRQTEFLIRRTEVQRVESSVKMEKKGAKLRSKSGQI